MTSPWKHGADRGRFCRERLRRLTRPSAAALGKRSAGDVLRILGGDEVWVLGDVVQQNGEGKCRWKTSNISDLEACSGFMSLTMTLKGVDVLIAAVRQLKAEGGLPADFSLTIIGKDEKGMWSGLEAEAGANDLPIRFLGEVDERTKRSEMSAADCLVLPTLSENFGLVVKESLELGVPVITTDGAKIWKGHAGVTYLDGFVAATAEERVKQLKEALGRVKSVGLS